MPIYVIGVQQPSFCCFQLIANSSFSGAMVLAKFFCNICASINYVERVYLVAHGMITQDSYPLVALGNIHLSAFTLKYAP